MNNAGVIMQKTTNAPDWEQMQLDFDAEWEALPASTRHEILEDYWLEMGRYMEDEE